MSAKISLCFIAIASVCGCNKVEKEWKATEREDTPRGYEVFLEAHSNSQFAPKAAARLASLYEAMDWDGASQTNTVHAFRTFIKKWPNSTNRQIAIKKIDEFALSAWKDTRAIDSSQAYKSFIEGYPESALITQANERLKECLTHEDMWSKVQLADTVTSYRSFLDAYPESQFGDEAITRLLQKCLFIVEDGYSEYSEAIKKDKHHKLEEFIERHPGSAYVYDVKRRLKAFKTYETAADTDLSFEMLVKLCNWDGKMKAYPYKGSGGALRIGGVGERILEGGWALGNLEIDGGFAILGKSLRFSKKSTITYPAPSATNTARLAPP